MLSSHILLALGWMTYGILHSLLATTSVKNWFAVRFGTTMVQYRGGYIAFATVSMAALIVYEWMMKSRYVFTPGLASKLSGILLGSLGVALMSICIWKYFLRLSGIRSAGGQAVENKLRIEGVHRLVRHPLYLGTFAALWGLFFLLPLGSVLVSNVVITLYTLLAIPFEERKLIIEFGEDYVRYRQRVPMILPFWK